VPSVKNRFSFSWSWSHFIENAQDWTYASSPGLQDWDNIRTAQGWDPELDLLGKRGNRDYLKPLRQSMVERTRNYRS
jgi:hypothetical protein